MLLKFLFALFSLVQLVDGALKLQLNSRESKTLELLREGKFNEYKNWRLNHRKELEQKHGQFDVGHSKIYDYQDWYYVVNISIGTPPQNFILLPDVSVSQSWIPDISTPRPKRATSPWICDEKSCFKGNESSTYFKNGRSYGGDPDGQSSGFLGIDTIRLGDSDIGQLSVINATFGQATSVYWDHREFDGVLGLAFQSNSSHSVESIFQTAIRQKLVDKPMFTFWLENEGENSIGKRGGQLTFGDYDSENCEPSQNIIYFPLIHKTKYLFNIDGIEINNQQTLKKYSVVPDSSTFLIFTPIEILNVLVKTTNAVYDFDDGSYKVSCDTKLNFSIIHSGITLTINEKFAIIDFNNEGYHTCSLAFDVWDKEEPDFVLGSPFNTAFCQTYDMSGNGRIGYSESIEYIL